MATPGGTYRETHPWLTFSIDLNRISYKLWLLLGEVTSKTDHVRRALLRPEVAAELLQVFLIKGALATTAIEGNTLSEAEARQVADDTLELPPSKAYLGQEVRNILDACNTLRDEIFEGPRHVALTVDKVKEYNRRVLRDLDPGEDVIPGEIRTHSVVVGNYRGAPAEECEALLGQMCEWLSSGAFEAPADRQELREPLIVLKAIIAHLYLTWIHPFGDGNGRTARLLELHILLAGGFPMPTCQLLSNHYNRTRSEYYRQLSRASRDGAPYAFLEYAGQGLADELRAQLDRIWTMQYFDRWEQYIHQSFGQPRTETDHRRLRLVKDLSTQSINPTEGHWLPQLVPVPRSHLRRLSPALAEAYAKKTDRTLSRDVNWLLNKGLIERRRGGFVPASDEVLAFMPLARPNEGEGTAAEATDGG